MAEVEGLFFDTNILIPGLVPTRGSDTASRELFVRLARGELGRPQTAVHCLLEFLSVTTRWASEYRLSPSQAAVLAREEILRRFDLCSLPGTHVPALVEALEAEGIAGGQIYDLQIAQVALASGAKTVITNNPRHFTSLRRHGLRVLTAAELLAELGGS
ncbi:MAG TPA: PIN domain-containing protein [Thermoanaerobaculia bacterium]|nr:PIN domain-containing protein [Thermoanaerobaculia bacterium]